MSVQRVAVIDLGSNSFRMVVFACVDGGWRHERELSRAVRIGEGLAQTGKLSGGGVERGLAAMDDFVALCEQMDLQDGRVDAVATSAIRDADDGRDFLELLAKRTGLQVRVLSREQEARYGYLAAVNSTSLTDGVVLDLGGGSLQLVRVAGRLARESASLRMGAVRMTERFLPGPDAAGPEQVQALRDHVAHKLAKRAPWLPSAGRHLVGLGGTARSLAAAAKRAEGLDGAEVHGYTIRAGILDDLLSRLAALPVADRGSVPGIRAGRADIVLAGALVIQEAMRAGGFQALEVTGASLREGIFFERQLAQRRLDTLLLWPRKRAA